MEPSPYTSAEAWGVGHNRGSILESLALSGDMFSPWFNNDGILTFIRTFNPANRVPDFNFDAGNQVMRAGIVKNDDLLTAPNIFIVASNSATSDDLPAVGRASVPVNAPNSVINRGFEIPEVQNLQLSDSTQAQAVAEALVNRQAIYERVSMSTAPDPRFDSYNVVH